jgi:hypothetical protein
MNWSAQRHSVPATRCSSPQCRQWSRRSWRLTACAGSQHRPMPRTCRLCTTQSRRTARCSACECRPSWRRIPSCTRIRRRCSSPHRSSRWPTANRRPLHRTTPGSTTAMPVGSTRPCSGRQCSIRGTRRPRHRRSSRPALRRTRRTHRTGTRWTGTRTARTRPRRDRGRWQCCCRM